MANKHNLTLQCLLINGIQLQPVSKRPILKRRFCTGVINLPNKRCKKQNFVAALSVLAVLSTSAIASQAAAADSQTQPQATQERAEHVQQPRLLKGTIEYRVPQGTPIKLKLATVPTNGMRLLDRDLDGNLLPAQVGQEITAKTQEDIYVDDNKVIPEGTVFHGTVTSIVAPKRINRPGSVCISFDELTTPDGRSFAFRAEADSTKKSTNGTKLHGFGIITAHAAGGAIVGAMVAYQIFGLHNTIAMHGYNIAGGAAGGALLAAGWCMMQKGHKATLEPGADLNMKIDKDLLMPAAVDPVVKKQEDNLPGLEITFRKTKLIKDGLGEFIQKIEADVSNSSSKNLNSIDLFLEDSNGTRSPLCTGNEDDPVSADYIFTITPRTKRRVNLNFQVEFPKMKRKLVWLDHDDRQICYSQKLPDQKLP